MPVLGVGRREPDAALLVQRCLEASALACFGNFIKFIHRFAVLKSITKLTTSTGSGQGGDLSSADKFPSVNSSVT